MCDDPALASPERENFTSRMIKVYCTDENFERRDRAKKLGEKKGGYTAVEVALAWLLHKPFPIVPIVGPHNQEELASCVKATSL
jgi:aryl-alcohol dehydrogenase-like predicted oxidoreductase